MMWGTVLNETPISKFTPRALAWFQRHAYQLGQPWPSENSLRTPAGLDARAWRQASSLTLSTSHHWGLRCASEDDVTVSSTSTERAFLFVLCLEQAVLAVLRCLTIRAPSTLLNRSSVWGYDLWQALTVKDFWMKHDFTLQSFLILSFSP